MKSRKKHNKSKNKLNVNYFENKEKYNSNTDESNKSCLEKEQFAKKQEKTKIGIVDNSIKQNINNTNQFQTDTFNEQDYSKVINNLYKNISNAYSYKKCIQSACNRLECKINSFIMN